MILMKHMCWLMTHHCRAGTCVADVAEVGLWTYEKISAFIVRFLPFDCELIKPFEGQKLGGYKRDKGNDVENTALCFVWMSQQSFSFCCVHCAKQSHICSHPPVWRNAEDQCRMKKHKRKVHQGAVRGKGVIDRCSTAKTKQIWGGGGDQHREMYTCIHICRLNHTDVSLV